MGKFNLILIRSFLLTFLLIIFLKNECYGQKSVQIQHEQKKIRKEIELIEELINETKEKKNKTSNELKILNRKIELRTEYIKNLNKELLEIETNIFENTKLIGSLENDLINIKKEYARLIYNAYKNRDRENYLLYILSSNSFNQAYKRIKYIQLYMAYKKRQVNLIRAYEKVIRKKNEELAQNKQNRESLLAEREKELLNNLTEKEERKKIIISLQEKEKDLREEVKKKKAIADKLQSELERIIAEERKGAKSIYETLTPAEKLISGNFERNKGKLPWPTNQGIITGRFGIQQHPVLKNVKIRNDGIFISTVENEDARAIYDGVVSKIFSLPGSNFAVIIKHGNYYTLYHNLDEVYVKEGEIVKTKEKIGRIYTDKSKNETVLQFQVWREMERNDPEIWLSK